jgi:hypothetical protein
MKDHFEPRDTRAPLGHESTPVARVDDRIKHPLLNSRP